MLHPRTRLMEYIRQIRELEDKLHQTTKRRLENEKHRLMLYSERLNGLSPLNKLGNGYVYATETDGKPVQTAKQLCKNAQIRLRLADGTADVRVEDICISDGGEEKDNGYGSK